MTIARRILIQVALGVAFVVAVVTAVTYARVYGALKERGLRQLDTYVRERADREEARFLQIQSNLALVRGQYVKRLDMPMSPERVEERFNHWYRRYDDGAWRSREQFKDARKTSSMWADKEWQPTPELRRQVVVVQELCDEMLPGWVDTFPSYYLQFLAPGYVNVGVDTKIPEWSWAMPAHYESEGVEWLDLAAPHDPPPPDRYAWTGAQEDPATAGIFVCVYLPVYRGGEFIGSVGHNMPLDGSLSSAIQSEVSGAAHFIFRTDGRLIAHPGRTADIVASKGQLRAQDCGDAILARLHALASARPERRFAGFEENGEFYYSVARLAGPEWLYTTTMTRAHLQRQAFVSAQWVLWSGLVSLALVLAFIAYTLRRQITRPLAELARTADAMAAGGKPAPLAARADELGALASSFREMVARIAARECDLRELNAGLEKRVASRTEELAIALAREKELGEMKDNFITLVSHEFRTPLGVIMSAADVLDRYFERLPAEKRAKHFAMIRRSTKNLAQLIEEVLILGRVEEGRIQFAPVPIELERLCLTLADELRSATSGACPIRFRALTALDGAVSDEAMLRHILSNLLSNAVKYSERGVPVEFTAARDGGDLILIVSDGGIGIPAEDQARLFTSFTRASNVGTRPGTGLGLVVVQRCVALHGGTIRLESTAGKGTAVTVALPVFPNPQSTTRNP